MSFCKDKPYTPEDCPQIPPPSPNQLVAEQSKGLASVMKAMGVQACKSTVVGGGGFSIFPPGAIGGAATVNIGCDSLTAMASAVEQHQQQMACVINNTSENNCSQIQNIEEVNIKLAKGSEIKGGIDIVQQIQNQTEFVTQLSTQQQIDIQSIMTSMVKSLGTAVQKAQSEFGSEQEGQKAVKQFTDYLSQQSTMDAVTNAVSNTISDIFNRQSVTIVLDEYSIIGEGVKIDQSVINSVRAQSIMDAGLKVIFSSDQGAKVVEQFKTEQDQENKGIAQVIGALSGPLMIIGLLVLGGLLLFGGSTLTSVMKYVLPIAVVVFIALGVYFGFKKEWIQLGIASGAAVLLVVATIFTSFKKVENKKK